MKWCSSVFYGLSMSPQIWPHVVVIIELISGPSKPLGCQSAAENDEPQSVYRVSLVSRVRSEGGLWSPSLEPNRCRSPLRDGWEYESTAEGLMLEFAALVILCVDKQANEGTISPTISHYNSNLTEIIFCSYPNCIWVITTKLCMWHGSCAFVACTKVYGDLMSSNRMAVIWISHQNKEMWPEKHQWKGPWSHNGHRTAGLGFNTNMLLYQYKTFHCRDTTIRRA